MRSRMPTTRNPTCLCRRRLAVFSGKMLDHPRWASRAGVELLPGVGAGFKRGLTARDLGCEDLLDPPPIARDHRADGTHEQQEPPTLSLVEQTPVAGSVRATCDAAVTSPSIQATTERTCSYPVVSRNVGARP